LGVLNLQARPLGLVAALPDAAVRPGQAAMRSSAPCGPPNAGQKIVHQMSTTACANLPVMDCIAFSFAISDALEAGGFPKKHFLCISLPPSVAQPRASPNLVPVCNELDVHRLLASV